MGRSRSARAKQSLPFRGTCNILNVGAVAVVQRPFFQEVLHVAIWAFEI